MNKECNAETLNEKQALDFLDFLRQSDSKNIKSKLHLISGVSDVFSRDIYDVTDVEKMMYGLAGFFRSHSKTLNNFYLKVYNVRYYDDDCRRNKISVMVGVHDKATSEAVNGFILYS